MLVVIGPSSEESYQCLNEELGNMRKYVRWRLKSGCSPKKNKKNHCNWNRDIGCGRE
jgi:hypothetical protein